MTWKRWDGEKPRVDEWDDCFVYFEPMAVHLGHRPLGKIWFGCLQVDIVAEVPRVELFVAETLAGYLIVDHTVQVLDAEKANPTWWRSLTDDEHEQWLSA